jgi:hypothetical protein
VDDPKANANLSPSSIPGRILGHSVGFIERGEVWNVILELLLVVFFGMGRALSLGRGIQLKQLQRHTAAAAAQTPIKPLYKSLDVHMDKAVGRLIVATCTPHDVSERLGALAHWDRHLFNSADDDDPTLRALSCSTLFKTIKTDKWQTRVFNDFVKEKSFSESVQSKVYMHFTDRVNNFRKRFCDR